MAIATTLELSLRFLSLAPLFAPGDDKKESQKERKVVKELHETYIFDTCNMIITLAMYTYVV